MFMAKNFKFIGSFDNPDDGLPVQEADWKKWIPQKMIRSISSPAETSTLTRTQRIVVRARPTDNRI
jgi:hypothetical protein